MRNEPDYAADRAAAVEWARELLTDDFVILDTETTGLETDAEIVQIAVIEKTGAVLLDTLLRPTQPIPTIATSIHGITDAMVETAPTFGQIFDALLMAIGGKRCVIYNASYDVRLLNQTEQWHQIKTDSTWECLGMEAWRLMAVWDDAMQQYAAFVGDWSDWHGGYRYQQLPGGDHTALGDARATLRLIQRMAGVPNIELTIRVMDQELVGYEAHYARYYINGSFGKFHETPIDDALSAFVADLVFAYTDRAGSRKRQQAAHDWLELWRRDQGWRPVFEDPTTRASEE